VLDASSYELYNDAKELLEREDIEDYTFEERYCRGHERPVKKLQDQLDYLHFRRLETMVGKISWNVFETFVFNCTLHPKKVACVWMDEDAKETARWTYRDLMNKARSVAVHLTRDLNLRRGDRVLLVYEPCLEFFAAFWACIGTGIIAVPVCPPDPFSPMSDATEKLLAIWNDCDPKLILTSSKYKDVLAGARNFLANKFEEVMEATDGILDLTRRLWIATDILPDAPAEWKWPDFRPQLTPQESDVAFLQYTSGSTGGAKGVVVTHWNLGCNAMNCTLLTQGLGDFATYQWGIGVSWLPTFHDMGLIGFHVAPMLIGGTMVYFSPIHFIQQPTMWLHIISRFKHVFTGAPPFALDLCVRRVTPEEMKVLDLSSIACIILGAEPIRASFMDDFTAKFRRIGFRPESYMTCFGMAENVLYVAGKWSNKYEVRKLRVDSGELAKNRLMIYEDMAITYPGTKKEFYTADENRAKATYQSVVNYSQRNGEEVKRADGNDSQWIVSSGEIVPFRTRVTCEIRDFPGPKRLPHFYRRELSSYITIVDPYTLEELPEGMVGEIWITGPSKTLGYWNKPEENARSFNAKLAKITRQDTRELYEWVKGKKLFTDLNAKNRFCGLTEEDLVKLEFPVMNLLAPFADGNGQINWLRTGDMGVLYDGNLFITGRFKEMIIIRGQNFYAHDIEHALYPRGNADFNTNNETLRRTLSSLRPGSAIAYSITIPSDGTPTCPARISQAEGEHLAIIVELQVGNSADDEEEGSGSDNEGASEAEVRRRGGARTQGTAPQSSQAVPKKNVSIPKWQQWLARHGDVIVGGLANTYEAEEARLLRQVGASSAYASSKEQGVSCGTKVKTVLQKAFLGCVRGTIAVVDAASSYLYPPPAEALEAAEDKTRFESLESATQALTRPETKMDSSQAAAGLDAAALKARLHYTDAQLESIANAIRRVITSKFLVNVGQITFLAPKSIKKTTSGKKRRAATISAIANGEMNDRIIKRFYSKPIEHYLKLKEKQKATGGNDGTAATAAGSTIAPVSSTSASTSTSTQSSTSGSSLGSSLTGGQQPQATGGDMKQSPMHGGGTVGVSLENVQAAYDVRPNAITHVSSSVEALGNKDTVQKPPRTLAPPRHGKSRVLPNTTSKDNHEQKRITLEEVRALQEKAASLTFEDAKARVLRIIVQELQAQRTAPQLTGEDAEIAEANRAFTAEDKPMTPWGEEITVEYLYEMSKRSAEEQQNRLDEFGMDSVLGFKIGKVLATEFGLPPGMIGPHLFTQDPSIDGMVRVMMKLVQLQADRAMQEYEAQNAPINSGPSNIVLEGPAIPATEAELRLGLGAGQGGQGTRRINGERLPYILAIGTAVPPNSCPQQELMQAMLPSLKLDKKGEERFKKISANTGIFTRYSAIDSLEGLFWGREGVNSGNDEFVDARQEVYKRESVRLSIESAADCLKDWMGTRRRLTDSERCAERDRRFRALQERLQREKIHGLDKDKVAELMNSAEESIKRMNGYHGSGVLSKEEAEKVNEKLKRGGTETKDETYRYANLSSLAQAHVERTITHVVAVTCTGVIVPGLEFYIMQALGLPLSTQRLSIQFMGCFGCVSGIRCASALAAEDPRNRVLVVCTELCTLHLQLNDKVDNLIATSLFGDGSGAFIVGCDPSPRERPLYAIHGCSSFVIPDTINHMAWEMTKTGLKIGLAKEIPGEIFNNIGEFVDAMLRNAPDNEDGRMRVSIRDCNCAIHPGGPLIVNTIQDVLGLDPVADGHGNGKIDMDAPTAETWAILREYGNISSATLVFVLDRIRDNPKKRYRWTPTIAFGPGLSIEGALLKACFPTD